MRPLVCLSTLSLAAAGMLASATSAHADRVSPLEGQPPIRHKAELRDGRFEIAPTFEASIGADFKTTLSGGLKLDYHLTDNLSIGVIGFYGTGINTGLLNQIVTSLPGSEGSDPTPTQDEALQHANTIPFHGGVGLTFTPWAGKLSLFGKLFVNFDFYFSGGFGFALTKNEFPGGDKDVVCDNGDACSDPTTAKFNDPRNDGPHNAGFNPGVQFGGGLHIFFSQSVALDVYLRDYMFTDNPSGFDYTGDLAVTDADRRFLSHLFLGVGISFYLPGARISK